MSVSEKVYAEIIGQSLPVTYENFISLYNGEREAIENRTESDDPFSTSDSGDTATTEESSVANHNADRFSIEGQDINTFTAGRYEIWKNYAKHLNMIGNDFSKTDWGELTGKTVKHAHNNFLEIGYRCGIPVAVLHLLLELVSGYICIIWLFSPKHKDTSYFFSIVFLITYAIQSAFDIATLPFERPAPYFFYLALVPIFTFSYRGKNDKYLSEGDMDNNGIR